MERIREFVGPVNKESFQKVLIESGNGFISPRNDLFSVGPSESIWKKAISSRGGDIYRRVRASQQRIISNAERPLGNTPVKGTGVYVYGTPRRNTFEHSLNDSDMEYIRKRADRIDHDQKEDYDLFKQIADSASTPVDDILATWELHQVLTGGGYDNSARYDTYMTAWKFVNKQKGLPDLDDTLQEYVVQACDSLRDHFVECGMQIGSLQPLPYTVVRADQNTDGVIGFPILEKGSLEFSPKVARAIKASYGIDLSHLIGSQVTDDYAQYSGPCRNLDAVAELLKRYSFDFDTMAPIITIFARIQRHGYKLVEDELQPKDGKARAVFVPDALYGGCGAMVGAAFQKALMDVKVPDFPSLMNPEDQASTVMDLVRKALDNNYVCLSTDESQYDATLMNTVMATIMERVVKPFFKEEFWPMVDICTVSLLYKVLVFPDVFMSYLESEEQLDPTTVPPKIKGSYLVPCVNGGLISGHKLTHIMGSMYGRVMCQKVYGYMRGYVVPPSINDGIMAGDDNVMVIPRDQVKLESEEACYTPIAEGFAVFGMEVNPNKQIHIVREDEPLTVFLQKAYHSGLNIKGIGSAARQLVAVNFSEHSPRFNEAMQWIAQLSVMNNGYNSPFIDAAVKQWLEQDPELTKLFQDHGEQAWDILIEQAGTEQMEPVLNLSNHASFAYAEDPEEMVRDMALHIVPIVARVARDVDRPHVEDGDDREIDGTEAPII